MKPQYTVIVPLYNFFERASELLHKVWCIVGVPDSSAEALTFGVQTRSSQAAFSALKRRLERPYYVMISKKLGART